MSCPYEETQERTASLLRRAGRRRPLRRNPRADVVHGWGRRMKCSLVGEWRLQKRRQAAALQKGERSRRIMHFGEIEVRCLDGGGFRLDGGAMFGVVPKPLWEKKSPPDEKNRIRMRANALLVRAAGKTIVVETGNGTKWDTKQRAIYAVQEGDPLLASLHGAGVQPDDIDLVINTHLHFDHAGGNTRTSGDRAIPTFRNARYVVQKSELEHALNPTERDRASYLPDNFRPLTDAGLWKHVDGDAEIFPGVSVARIPGHNADIQAVVLR